MVWVPGAPDGSTAVPVVLGSGAYAYQPVPSTAPTGVGEPPGEEGDPHAASTDAPSRAARRGVLPCDAWRAV